MLDRCTVVALVALLAAMAVDVVTTLAVVGRGWYETSEIGRGLLERGAGALVLFQAYQCSFYGVIWLMARWSKSTLARLFVLAIMVSQLVEYVAIIPQVQATWQLLWGG